MTNFLTLILVWKVKMGKSAVLWERFSEAKEDFKSLEKGNRKIYPILIPFMKFHKLPEHKGW